MYVLGNHPRSADRQFLRDCQLRLSMLMRSGKEYDEPTYRRIMKLAESPDHMTSVDAFSILWTMGKSVHRKEILKLGRKFAASNDESKAFDGIVLLQGFGDTSWKAFASRFKDSRSEIMRDLANEN